MTSPHGCKCSTCKEEQRGEAKRLYLETHMTMPEIAKAVGRHVRTINGWLQDMGVKR